MNGPVDFIPVLPETAPFTAEQRAYLNGFFAGVFSRAPAAESPAAPYENRTLQPLAILFGSQTGNAERLAKRAAKEANNHGFAPTVYELGRYPTVQLASEAHLLIVTSTYGDGDPPDNAKSLWDFLRSDTAPKLPRLRFSLCALGDSNYAKFCGFGKELDARLEQLGATRVQPRADCDVEFEPMFVDWLQAALRGLSAGLTSVVTPQAAAPEKRSLSPESEASFSRANPFLGRLLNNRKLTTAGSAKDVRHLEISLANSGLNYEVGDALGVMPQNDPALVAQLLAALAARGDESVPGKDGAEIALHEALASHYEITRIPRPLLELCAKRTGDELLKKVSAPEANGELTQFLWGRQVIDLLVTHPGVKFSPLEFVALLRKLQPRLYSIASSPKAHLGEAHLTVSAVRYESLGRARGGVCSTFLADRVAPDTPVPVFVHQNKAFRPPAPDVPLIMVGPGTGIAPFRAFLQERRAIGATGRNWLFFGDQRFSTDWLYRDEIESFHRTGLLTRLDLAWSRDQSEKVYVQHRLLEQAGEVFAWLEAGGVFYVCGDASRMAKDVDAALHEVIERAGNRSREQAAEYVKQLQASRRYQRDVY